MPSVNFMDKDYFTCSELYQNQKVTLDYIDLEKFDEAWKKLRGSILIGETDGLGDQERLYYDENKILVFTKWVTSTSV